MISSPNAVTPTSPTQQLKSFLSPITPPPSLVSTTSTTAVQNSLPDQSSFLNGLAASDNVTVTHFSEQKGGIVEKISVPSPSTTLLDASLVATSPIVEKIANNNPFINMSSPSSPTIPITPSKSSTNPFHNISGSSSGSGTPETVLHSVEIPTPVEFKSSNPFKESSNRARSKSPGIAVKTNNGSSRATSPCNGTVVMVDVKDLKRTPSFGGVRKVEVPLATVNDSTDSVGAQNNGLAEERKPTKVSFCWSCRE